MTTRNHSKTARTLLLPHGLAAAITVVLAGFAATPVQALEFGDTDGLHGTLNTTLSYGVAVRTAGSELGQDRQGVLQPADRQYGPIVGADMPMRNNVRPKGAFSANHDDGDLNYSSGSAFSNAIKATTELHLDYGRNLGAFVRASYFYDFANENNDKLTSAAKTQVGKRFRILDSFIYDNFSVDEHQASVRFGKQVLNWGESTFIQGGINAFNPFDVSQLHVAGAALKDAYLPVNMLSGSFSFTQNLSIEAAYLLEFAQTKPDPAGSYFSTNDFATLGGTYASLPFGLVPQPVKNPENYYSGMFRWRTQR